MQEEIDIRSEYFNGEEWNLEEMVNEIKKCLDIFIEKVDDRPVILTTFHCAILPDGNGEHHFWVGGQV